MTIDSAYRRLAAAILRLDVPTLAADLRAERVGGVDRSMIPVAPGRRLALVAIPEEQEVYSRRKRVA